MLHISPILSCPLGADMLHRRPYPSSEDVEALKHQPHASHHLIVAVTLFAARISSQRFRSQLSAPDLLRISPRSSILRLLLQCLLNSSNLPLFSPSFPLLLPRMWNRLCVLQFQRACPPRISSILILLVPCFPTHPFPTLELWSFIVHRFPLLLLISFPTPPPPLPPPKIHNQPATEQKPPKHRLEDSAVSERKGPLSRKDEWIFFFS